MALVNQPPILASSFAVNGDKNTIPTTNSGTEGLASLSLGFPPITQQPVSQGGIPPQRADFNGIFNLITNFLMFIQNGSIFAYSSSLDYQPPAIVYGNNALYRCIATNGANTSAGVQPLSNTSYWQPLIPVGGITVSGNTITVTNETGTQIQYTIDTITNPPLQSDSSNKIVTSAWVKAYAPSKTGSGASGTWNITATKATQDSNGKQITTTYLNRAGGNITGSIDDVTTEGIYFYNNAYATGNLPTQYGRLLVLNSNYTGKDSQSWLWQLAFDTAGKLKIRESINGGSWTDWSEIAYTNNPAFSGTPTAPTPSTSTNNTQIATTAFVNNYAPSKTGAGASGTWGININGNAKNDSQGQDINTTYVKGITANNATLTITKGNGATSTTTINNVAHSTSADTATKATQDSNGNTISSTYLKLSGGQMTGNYIVAPNSAVLVLKNGTQSQDGLGFWVSNTSGSIGIVDYNRDGEQNIFKCDPNTIPNFALGLTSQTPSTGDNSTRVATTAFVKSLFTASKSTNGWWEDGNTGIIYQWGKNIIYSTSKSFNFNISFPNNCFVVHANDEGGTVSLGSEATSKSSFNVYSPESTQVNFTWIAIGY